MRASRYFDGGNAKDVTCLLCAGSHLRRECPNRICMTCGGVGHARCRKSSKAQQCWNCLGRHMKDGNCVADVFAPECATKADLSGNTTPLCGCGSTEHLVCEAVSFKGKRDWKTDGLIHCTLCGDDGHTAYTCRKPAFISCLIRGSRNATEKGQAAPPDPRFPLYAQPEGLLPGAPATACLQSAQPSSSKQRREKAAPVVDVAAEGPAASGGADMEAPRSQEEKARSQGRSPTALARREAKQKAKKRKASAAKAAAGGGAGAAQGKKGVPEKPPAAAAGAAAEEAVNGKASGAKRAPEGGEPTEQGAKKRKRPK